MFRNKRKFYQSLVLIASMAAMIFVGCSSEVSDLRESDPKALQSKDWFRKGVDRFYLAYAESTNQISEKYPFALAGQNYLFGIGCYGEPKDPYSEIEVYVSHDGEEKETMRLFERHKLHHFSEQLADKSCEILMGSKAGDSLIENDLENELESQAGILHPWMYAGVICAGAGTGLVATAMEGIRNLTKAAAAVIGVMGSGYWCFDMFTGAVDKTIANGASKARVNFYRFLTEAEKIADKDLSLDNEKLDAYIDAIVNRDYRLAAAVYNPIFVKAFNERMDGFFEQGWSTQWWDNDRFFSAIREIETKINNDSGKNFHAAGNLFANQIQCGEKEISSCDESEDRVSCIKKQCFVLTDFLDDYIPADGDQMEQEELPIEIREREPEITPIMAKDNPENDSPTTEPKG